MQLLWWLFLFSDGLVVWLLCYLRQVGGGTTTQLTMGLHNNLLNMHEKHNVMTLYALPPCTTELLYISSNIQCITHCRHGIKSSMGHSLITRALEMHATLMGGTVLVGTLLN